MGVTRDRRPGAVLSYERTDVGARKERLSQREERRAVTENGVGLRRDEYRPARMAARGRNLPIVTRASGQFFLSWFRTVQASHSKQMSTASL